MALTGLYYRCVNIQLIHLKLYLITTLFYPDWLTFLSTLSYPHCNFSTQESTAKKINFSKNSLFLYKAHLSWEFRKNKITPKSYFRQQLCPWKVQQVTSNKNEQPTNNLQKFKTEAHLFQAVHFFNLSLIFPLKAASSHFKWVKFSKSCLLWVCVES